MCWFEIRKDPTQAYEPNPNPCKPAQNPKLENQPKATQTQLRTRGPTLAAAHSPPSPALWPSTYARGPSLRRPTPQSSGPNARPRRSPRLRRSSQRHAAPSDQLGPHGSSFPSAEQQNRGRGRDLRPQSPPGSRRAPPPEIPGLAPLNRLRPPTPPPIHAAATPNPSAAALPRAEHPPPVSDSAETILHRRGIPGRPDRRDSLAGTPRVDSWSPEDRSTATPTPPACSPERRRRTSPSAPLRRSFPQFQPSVSTSLVFFCFCAS